jgi:hypothetical protein
VGIVTDQATVFLYDGVQITHLCHVVVTFGAKFRASLDQQRRVLRGMGIVAIHTSTVCRSLVDHRRSRGIVVAPDTQLGRGFRQERRVIRTVGVMASQAAVILDNGVDPHSLGRFVVALETEGVALLYQHQFVGVAVIIMARFTIRLIERWMDRLHPGDLLGPFSVAGSTVGSLDGGWKNSRSQDGSCKYIGNFPEQCVSSYI